MWAAYFQENGAMRHTIAVAKFEHTVQYKLDEFVKRMSHPSVGIWWVWIECEPSQCVHCGEEYIEFHVCGDTE